MNTLPVRATSPATPLLKLADPRYVLPFNPLQVPPIRIPQPQPDPAPDVRGFGQYSSPEFDAAHPVLSVAANTFVTLAVVLLPGVGATGVAVGQTARAIIDKKNDTTR